MKNDKLIPISQKTVSNCPFLLDMRKDVTEAYISYIFYIQIHLI